MRVNMRSAKHDERIVSDQKITDIVKSELQKIFDRASLKAFELIPVCVRMRSAKHDERIVSDQRK